MGAVAAPAHDVLMAELRSEQGDYQWTVASALAAIGGSGLGEVYGVILAPPSVPFDGFVADRWEDFEDDKYWQRLARIAQLGERGQNRRAAEAGAGVEARPCGGDNAARVLGFIGDSSVGPHLADLIHDDDWLMVRAVVESLGRIRYASARSEIAQVARNHWYPPVRRIAKDALAALDGEHQYGRIEAGRPSYFDIDPKRLGFDAPSSCATTARYPTTPPGDEHFSSEASPERAKQFSYKYKAQDYGDENYKEGEEAPQPKIILIDQVPGFGQRGPDGWFLGSSRGEFGGELIWRSDDESDQLIVNDEIDNVHELVPGKFVVTAGLAHLGLDSGHVYRLEKSSGRWRTRWWLRLPGEPMQSWMTKKGTVVINTTNGSVLLGKNGDLRMADCTKS